MRDIDDVIIAIEGRHGVDVLCRILRQHGELQVVWPVNQCIGVSIENLRDCFENTDGVLQPS